MTCPEWSFLFKDQVSADIVKTQLKDPSLKLQTTIQPVFVSRKIGQDLQELEPKPQLINQQCVVYRFQCNLCDTGGYVGYTRGHLHGRVVGHNSTSSSVRKHYGNDLFIYLYTLFIQKFHFSIAGLNGDLYKIIRINS